MTPNLMIITDNFDIFIAASNMRSKSHACVTVCLARSCHRSTNIFVVPETVL